MTPHGEDTLDPGAAAWLAENAAVGTPLDQLPPELLDLARGEALAPPTRELAAVRDDVVGNVPIRIYTPERTGDALIVYFHGGGWSVGSIGIMDEVARELGHQAGAVVVSVGYRLAPEHPFPAGLDDCETVTRWALAEAGSFSASAERVVVAGESAGGNLSAAVALRLRDEGNTALAAQVLVYPALDNGAAHYPSRDAFDGIVVRREAMHRIWATYAGGQDIDTNPYAAPIHALTLAGLPPALVVVAGCDLLRDEGLAFAARLREDGVDVEEVCFSGQPHGFVNFGLPAAADAFACIADWLRRHGLSDHGGR